MLSALTTRGKVVAVRQMLRKLRDYNVHYCSGSASTQAASLEAGTSLSHGVLGHIEHCLSFHLEEQVLISLVGPAVADAR